MSQVIHLLKLGGSLLDLPDLPERLEALRVLLADERLILLVGGGPAADIVRDFDKRWPIGQEAAHWLAIRAMQLNAHLLTALLPHSRLVSQAQGCQTAWKKGDLAIVDPLVWLEQEHAQGVSVPHRWTFTSDSIAAHVARQIGSNKLTLLKSVSLPADCNLAHAAELGIVDADFPLQATPLAWVGWINLRSDSLVSSPLGR